MKINFLLLVFMCTQMLFAKSNDHSEQSDSYYKKRQPAQAHKYEKSKTVDIKTNDPRYSSGLRTITKDGKYIYDTSSARPEPAKKNGLEYVTEDGKYIYKPSSSSKSSSQKSDFRINTDGKYVYKKDASMLKYRSTSFRLGSLSFSNFEQSGVEFSDTYENAPLALFFDYDWQKPKASGIYSWKFSTALIYASGAGRFKNQSLNPDKEPRESYSFYAIPLNFGVEYRFQYKDSQTMVPYINALATYFAMIEVRDDGKTISAGVPAGTGSFGLNFNISTASWVQSFLNSYEGKSAWFSLELRQTVGFDSTYNISSSYALLGVAIDY